MENERWYEELESNIFTIVSYRIETALANKISKTIKFTRQGESTDAPYFPTCYIHELPSIEIGKTIEGTALNGLMEAVEINAYTRSKDECNLIIYEALYQMKQLGFEATAMPIMTDSDNIHTAACRFRRPIGADDSEFSTE